MSRFWVVAWVAIASVAGAAAQSFSLDDNPSAPIVPACAPGLIPGFGAEDPFGLIGLMFPPGLAPSPSLAAFPATSGDGAIFSPGPVLQTPSINGCYMSSFSAIKVDRPFTTYQCLFSVDRLTRGAAGTALSVEAGFNQQPGDIYRETVLLQAPSFFAGTLPPGPFSGFLPGAVAGVPNNYLERNQSFFGLLTGGLILPPGVPAPPPAFGTHDNIDGFDLATLTNPPPGMLRWTYFTIYPDEALAVGTSAAVIYDIMPGAPGGVNNMPWAWAFQIGLDTAGGNTDAIDALIVFDNNIQGGPAWGGPGAEPAIDYALFSLAPGSASLAMFGLSPSDLLYTDFTGGFAVYIPAPLFGVLPQTGVLLEDDNIDALDLICTGDIDLDGDVDAQDLAFLLAAWGTLGPAGDLDGNRVVDAQDLAFLLGNYGCQI